MKLKPAYLNHVFGVAILLLLLPAGLFAQEGYFGATNNIARAEETPLSLLAARSDIYTGSGEGYYGAQQPPDTCVESQQVTAGKTGPLVLVRGTKMGSATLPFDDQDAGLSTCAGSRPKSVRSGPDRSAPQNQVEYGGGGM